jgi:hypothetical protein
VPVFRFAGEQPETMRTKTWRDKEHICNFFQMMIQTDGNSHAQSGRWKAIVKRETNWSHSYLWATQPSDLQSNSNGSIFILPESLSDSREWYLQEETATQDLISCITWAITTPQFSLVGYNQEHSVCHGACYTFTSFWQLWSCSVRYRGRTVWQGGPWSKSRETKSKWRRQEFSVKQKTLPRFFHTRWSTWIWLWVCCPIWTGRAWHHRWR